MPFGYSLHHSSNVLALIYFVLKGIGIMKSSPMTLQKEDLICTFLQQEEEIYFSQAKKVLSDQLGASLRGDFPSTPGHAVPGAAEDIPGKYREQMSPCTPIPPIHPFPPSSLTCLSQMGPRELSLRRGTTDPLRERGNLCPLSPPWKGYCCHL